jgi:hypothetical protein
LSHIKELIAWRASKTLSCQRETLHSQQLRSIKKSIDSDHGIYRDPANPPASYLIDLRDNFTSGRRKPGHAAGAALVLVDHRHRAGVTCDARPRADAGRGEG